MENLCVKKVRILWLRLTGIMQLFVLLKFMQLSGECSMYDGEEDDFIVCPECEEPIYLDDYPEFDGAADKSFCICPICEQRLNLV